MGRLRYSIPNSFTALSLLLGVGSIVSAQLGDLEFAAWMIVWCGLLDTMDGLTARLLKATSDFGAEFDSMADLVAFGVAPGVLVVHAGLQIAGIELQTGQFWVLLAACGVFVLAGAMRLARFNLGTYSPGHGWFLGVPITGAGGGLVASMVLVLIHHQDVADVLPLHRYLPIVMFILAILMVSRLRFPKAVIRKSKIVNTFMFVNVALIFYCGIFRVYPEYLFGIGVFLLVAGIIAGRITRDQEEQQ